MHFLKWYSNICKQFEKVNDNLSLRSNVCQCRQSFFASFLKLLRESMEKIYILENHDWKSRQSMLTRNILQMFEELFLVFFSFFFVLKWGI